MTPDPRPSALRVSVRPRAPLPLTAYRLSEPDTFRVQGRDVRAYPQDWVVSRGTEVVDVLPPSAFARLYEESETGTLVLTETDRSTLAHMLGHGSTDSSPALTRAVLKLAALSIGTVSVDFTPLQWEELSRRAAKRNQSTQAYLQHLVEKFTQDIWTAVV